MNFWRGLTQSSVAGTNRKRIRAVASLRNLVVGVLRNAGLQNIAKALCHNARSHSRPLTVLGII